MTTGQVSGHYAGAFTRLAAFVIDWFIIVTVYGFILSVTHLVLVTFFNVEIDFSDDRVLWLAGFIAWAFLYMVAGLTITGRTIGKTLLGLKVVGRNGEPLSAGRAAVRVIAMPLSFAVLGLGLLGVVLGRERRALHDVIARCAVVYDWGDRPAKLPAPMMRWMERTAAGRRGETVQPAESEPPPV